MIHVLVLFTCGNIAHRGLRNSNGSRLSGNCIISDNAGSPLSPSNFLRRCLLDVHRSDGGFSEERFPEARGFRAKDASASLFAGVDAFIWIWQW